MRFSDIIGQEDVKRRLVESVHENRIPHAQMFTGPSGVGKLQLAIAFAQYLACPNRSETDSCGHCPSCLQYSKLQHPDLHFVFPVMKTSDSTPVSDDYIDKFRAIVTERKYFDESDWFHYLSEGSKSSTDNKNKVCYIYERESQEIIRKLSFKSYSSEFKTMIIWLPERMYGDVCANKLLKILEEPPEKTLFILISERPEKLLPTIISRTQQIRIPRLSESDIISGLRSHDPEIDLTTAMDVAHIADGSFLRALQQLDADVENRQNFSQFVEMMRNAYAVGQHRDPIKKYQCLVALKNWCEAISDKSIGREARVHFLQYCQRMIRENFILNLHEPKLNYLTTAEREFSVKFSPFITGNNVEDIMQEFSLAQQQIEQNGSARIIFFDMCLKLIVYLKRK